jgi:hypothetical protein
MKKPKAQTQAQNIRDYFTKNPDKTVSEVARVMGVTYQIAYMTKRKMKPTPNEALPVTMEEPKADAVNHPAHYKVGGIETIDFIEAKGLNYNTGNAVKYITRADHKGNRKQDLEKAVWYLNREISRMQGA